MCVGVSSSKDCCAVDEGKASAIGQTRPTEQTNFDVVCREERSFLRRTNCSCPLAEWTECYCLLNPKIKVGLVRNSLPPTRRPHTQRGLPPRQKKKASRDHELALTEADRAPLPENPNRMLCFASPPRGWLTHSTFLRGAAFSIFNIPRSWRPFFLDSCDGGANSDRAGAATRPAAATAGETSAATPTSARGSASTRRVARACESLLFRYFPLPPRGRL